MDEKKPVELDDVDRDILNVIQASVPLDKRPFKRLGQQLGLGEDEVVSRIKKMWDLNVVRRLGPIVNYKAWGMSGLLVASKVEPDGIERAREVMAEYPEITHAYLRDHDWNLWFTVIAEDETARDAIIEKVGERAGLTQIRKLPQLKSYKLGVKFEV